MLMGCPAARGNARPLTDQARTPRRAARLLVPVHGCDRYILKHRISHCNRMHNGLRCLQPYDPFPDMLGCASDPAANMQVPKAGIGVHKAVDCHKQEIIRCSPGVSGSRSVAQRTHNTPPCGNLTWCSSPLQPPGELRSPLIYLFYYSTAAEGQICFAHGVHEGAD